MACRKVDAFMAHSSAWHRGIRTADATAPRLMQLPVSRAENGNFARLVNP